MFLFEKYFCNQIILELLVKKLFPKYLDKIMHIYRIIILIYQLYSSIVINFLITFSKQKIEYDEKKNIKNDLMPKSISNINDFI